VLVGDNLPELGTDLVTALAGLDCKSPKRRAREKNSARKRMKEAGARRGKRNVIPSTPASSVKGTFSAAKLTVDNLPHSVYKVCMSAVGNNGKPA
jgi:hypothetical protein